MTFFDADCLSMYAVARSTAHRINSTAVWVKRLVVIWILTITVTFGTWQKGFARRTNIFFRLTQIKVTWTQFVDSSRSNNFHKHWTISIKKKQKWLEQWVSLFSSTLLIYNHRLKYFYIQIFKLNFSSDWFERFPMRAASRWNTIRDGHLWHGLLLGCWRPVRCNAWRVAYTSWLRGRHQAQSDLQRPVRIYFVHSLNFSTILCISSINKKFVASRNYQQFVFPPTITSEQKRNV